MRGFKLLTLLFVMLIFFSSNGVYAEQVKGEGSASVGVFSNYVWRGQKLSDGAVIQPSVGITYGAFGANFWSNYDTDTNELSETDITLSYGFLLNKLSMEAGYIFYALDGVDDTQELYLTAGYDIILDPSLTLYYDFDEGDGAFLVASIGYSFNLIKDMSLGLGASGSIDIDNEIMGTDSDGNPFTDLYSGELSVSMAIPFHGFTIEPLIAYTFPLSTDAENSIEAADVSGESESSIFYGGVAASLSF